MSISSPQKKPISSPSFSPRMNPKEDVSIIMRFGMMPAKDRALNTLLCSTKHTMMNMVTMIFLSICTPPAALRHSVTVCFLSVMIRTSPRCSKSTAGTISPDLVRLLESLLIELM